MTEEFNKFLKWSYLDHNCSRRIEPDAPKEIKIEAKKADKYYFKRTGRHMLKIDYYFLSIIFIEKLIIELLTTEENIESI